MMRSVSKFIDEIENCGLKVSFQLEKYLHPLRPDFRNDDYSLIEAVNDRKTPVVNISARVEPFSKTLENTEWGLISCLWSRGDQLN